MSHCVRVPAFITAWRVVVFFAVSAAAALSSVWNIPDVSV